MLSVEESKKKKQKKDKKSAPAEEATKKRKPSGEATGAAKKSKTAESAAVQPPLDVAEKADKAAKKAAKKAVREEDEKRAASAAAVAAEQPVSAEKAAKAAKKAAKKAAREEGENRTASMAVAVSEPPVSAEKVAKAAKKAAKKAAREHAASVTVVAAEPPADVAEKAAKKAKKAAKKAAKALEEDAAAAPPPSKTNKQRTEKSAVDEVALTAPTAAKTEEEVVVPEAAEPTGDTTIVLFYAYCKHAMNKAQQDAAIAHCMSLFKKNDVTGRLRVAREGFNATLTGSHEGVRAFTASLVAYDGATFGETDFKYVDNLPDSQKLKGIKCWPVSEIVTYGFDPKSAPLGMRGTHLTPRDFHAALASPDSIAIDVRNFNETLIGKFAPAGGAEVLDPLMRRSTEFPEWVDANKQKLEGKKVLMYCTGGVRCERASAFMRSQGVQNVYQLEGGIHRYLEEFAQDGGHWVGKNYTFDKRFSHGAQNAETISRCVCCEAPWDRYQAQAKCHTCKIEVLLCRPCQRRDGGPPKKHELSCPLCSPSSHPRAK